MSSTEVKRCSLSSEKRSSTWSASAEAAHSRHIRAAARRTSHSVWRDWATPSRSRRASGGMPSESMVLAHLEASGVRVDGGLDEGAKTTLAIATLAAGIASYDFRIDWDIEALAPLPVETRCLHTGSLATVLPPGKANVVDLMEREHERGRVTISYDPNVRPALLGDAEQARPEIEHLVAVSDVVKVSEEDLRWLYPDRSDEDVARGWLASGPALVVVTRGGAGVYAVSARPGAAPRRGDDRSRGHGRRGGLLHLGSARRAASR